jgi:hypothetical protein
MFFKDSVVHRLHSIIFYQCTDPKAPFQTWCLSIICWKSGISSTGVNKSAPNLGWKYLSCTACHQIQHLCKLKEMLNSLSQRILHHTYSSSLELHNILQIKPLLLYPTLLYS